MALFSIRDLVDERSEEGNEFVVFRLSRDCPAPVSFAAVVLVVTEDCTLHATSARRATRQTASRATRRKSMSCRVSPSIARSARISPTTEQNLKP